MSESRLRTEIQQWFWDFGDGTTSRLQNPSHTYTDGGEFSVSLTVVSAHGSDTATATITVDVIPPTAAFSVSDTTPFVGDTVTFTNASTAGSAEITDYLWEFGDGASSSEVNPTYTYNSAGTFAVRLTVITPHGSDTASRQVTVSFMPPTAAFSADNQTPDVGDPVQFMDESLPGTAAVSQWLWDFGDPDSGANNTSALKNPTHTYNSPGVYTVTLTVTTPVASDNTDTIVRTDFIQAIQPPVAHFTSAVTSEDTPDIIQFTDTSTPGSQSIVSRLWDFGDVDSGVDNTSSAQNPTHQFTTEGTFLVTLTVSTATSMASVSNMVTVEFLPPTVDFTVETGSTNDPIDVLADGALTTDTLRFNSLITLGTETDTGLFQYAWDFGDGNQSSLEEPVHQYTNGGTYTVSYTVTTPTDEVTVEYDVVVDEPPLPDFSALPQERPVNVDVQFFDQTSNDGGVTILGYLWEFGDGTISTDQEPTHSYELSGVYTVSLTLTFNHSETGVQKTITETKVDYIIITQ